MTKNPPTFRVLIIEDELLIRWSIVETLTSDGYEVIEADSAAAALRALAEQSAPVDAVLLDYRLPDSNDLTLLSNIRRLSPDSAVVMMTAFGTPEVTKGAHALGAYKVLSKPFDLHDLAPLLLEAHTQSQHRAGRNA
jgi:DNA-binding NtrC family response regulator